MVDSTERNDGLSPAEQRFRSREPFLFFASRMALEGLRAKVHLLGDDIWLAGFSAPEWIGRPGDDEVQLACVKRVRAARSFVCVLDNEYGKPWSLSDVCILETEILMASLSCPEVSVLLLKPFHPDPALASLLEVLDSEILDRTPKSESQILEIVAARREALAGTARASLKVYGRMAQTLARRATGNYSPGDLDVSFLNGGFAPVTGKAFNPVLIESLIARSDEREEVPDRLIELWTAVRHLSSVPYTSARFREFVPLWHRVLGRWASASAWYDLHGHHRLGRLAAVNTVSTLRKTMRGRDDGEMAIQGTQGAIASEYYSIAKLVPNKLDRWKLRKRALKSVNAALAEGQPDPSGLRAIRGSIHLALLHPQLAVEDYRACLKLRLADCQDEGRIGEAEVELGFGYFLLGMPWKAEPLLKSGVEKLRRARRWPFLVRGLRKLGFFYRLTLRPMKSREVLLEALELAEKQSLAGQIRQIREG